MGRKCSLVEKSIILDISTPELLHGKAIGEASIKVFLKGSVEETDQRFAIQDVVEFMKPELELSVRWDIKNARGCLMNLYLAQKIITSVCSCSSVIKTDHV